MEQAKVNILAEMDAANAKKSQAAFMNPNLVSAV